MKEVKSKCQGKNRPAVLVTEKKYGVGLRGRRSFIDLSGHLMGLKCDNGRQKRLEGDLRKREGGRIMQPVRMLSSVPIVNGFTVVA